jgi:hypothetical protein
MKMQDEHDKKAIRDLMQVADAPAMRSDFQDRMTAAWLEKSHDPFALEANGRQTFAAAIAARPKWWALTVLFLGAMALGYWQHLREIEELHQFDILLEFSMGTL